MSRTAQEIVQAEIKLCVSSLIATLASGAFLLDAHLSPQQQGRVPAAIRAIETLCRQAAELAAPIADYEQAALDAGWSHGGDFDGFWFNQEEFGSWKAAASSDDAATYATAKQVCEFEDIEPHSHDVFEHWSVTEWLADRLQAKGEKLDRDFAGLIVWARTTTGQQIVLDAVIQEIAADLTREYGEG